MPPSSSSLTVLTAATSWEARPLARALGLELRDPGAYEGSRKRGRLLLLQTGIGRRKTAACLARMERGIGPGLIAVSSGLAGALQAGIRSADLVADMRSAPLELVQRARETAEALRLPLHWGVLHSSDRVLADPDEKRSVGRRCRAAAVDMESAAVRDWCEERGGVFLGLRAVFDPVEQALPGGDYDPDDPGSLRRFVLRHPAQWPRLARLFLQQRRALGRLAKFLDAFFD